MEVGCDSSELGPQRAIGILEYAREQIIDGRKADALAHLRQHNFELEFSSDAELLEKLQIQIDYLQKQLSPALDLDILRDATLPTIAEQNRSEGPIHPKLGIKRYNVEGIRIGALGYLKHYLTGIYEQLPLELRRQHLNLLVQQSEDGANLASQEEDLLERFCAKKVLAYEALLQLDDERGKTVGFGKGAVAILRLDGVLTTCFLSVLRVRPALSSIELAKQAFIFSANEIDDYENLHVSLCFIDRCGEWSGSGRFHFPLYYLSPGEYSAGIEEELQLSFRASALVRNLDQAWNAKEGSKKSSNRPSNVLRRKSQEVRKHPYTIGSGLGDNPPMLSLSCLPGNKLFKSVLDELPLITDLKKLHNKGHLKKMLRVAQRATDSRSIYRGVQFRKSHLVHGRSNPFRGKSRS